MKYFMYANGDSWLGSNNDYALAWFLRVTGSGDWFSCMLSQKRFCEEKIVYQNQREGKDESWNPMPFIKQQLEALLSEKDYQRIFRIYLLAIDDHFCLPKHLDDWDKKFFLEKEVRPTKEKHLILATQFLERMYYEFFHETIHCEPKNDFHPELIQTDLDYLKSMEFYLPEY